MTIVKIGDSIGNIPESPMLAASSRNDINSIKNDNQAETILGPSDTDVLFNEYLVMKYTITLKTLFTVQQDNNSV